jgi:hypothetical protein
MEGRPALWTLIGVFVVFKVATTIMIILAAPGAAGAIIALFVAFHWPFMLAAVIFGAAPALFWWRLMRVRAKRARLQAEEWRVDPPVSPPVSRN